MSAWYPLTKGQTRFMYFGSVDRSSDPAANFIVIVSFGPKTFREITYIDKSTIYDIVLVVEGLISSKLFGRLAPKTKLSIFCMIEFESLYFITICIWSTSYKDGGVIAPIRISGYIFFKVPLLIRVNVIF